MTEHVRIFQNDELFAALKFVGQNAIGLSQTWEFPVVLITPNKAISLLSDGWQEIEVEGEVLLQHPGSSNQLFGTITMADGGTAPATSNYSIGKGILYIDLSQTFPDQSGWIDLGNVSKIDFEIKVTKLDHFSSRGGIKTKDRVAVTERSATIAWTMDEITMQNFAIALMGNVLPGSP